MRKCICALHKILTQTNELKINRMISHFKPTDGENFIFQRKRFKKAQK